MPSWKEPLHHRWEAFSRTPFGCLLRLFVGRMFHGGDETGTEDLGLGVGAILTLLAMPGLLVSLLMFEKYGSLISCAAMACSIPSPPPSPTNISLSSSR
jgi:hypothetical protein